MKQLRLLFVSLMALLSAITVYAEDVTIDGINYRLNGEMQTARVMPSSDYSYAGAVNIPPSVTWGGVTYRVNCIGSDAFNNCQNLTAITLPNTIDSILTWAFRLTPIESLVVPANTIYIGTEIVAHCPNLKSLKVADGNPVYDSRDNCNAIIITRNNTLIVSCCTTVIPNTVTDIGDVAFNGYQGTELVIPEGVERIYYGAFCYSESLTKITLPSTLVYIGNNALAGCTSLRKVYCYAVNPPSVTGSVTDRNTFQNTDLFVPAESVNAYRQDYSWRQFLNVLSFEEDVPLPPEEFPTGKCGDNLTYSFELTDDVVRDEINGRNVWTNGIRIVITGTGAMYDYDTWWATPWTNAYRYRIYEVVLPNGLTHVGDNAFGGCINIKSLELPSTCTSVGKDGFYNCHLQDDLHLPEGLTTLGDRAFCSLMYTRNVYLPASLTSIGVAGVAGIQQQENFYLNEANPNYKLINNSLIEKATNTLIAATKNAIIPSTVTAIGPEVFASSRCERMPIPEGVISIGEDAFGHSYLKEITIPNSVTTIGDLAFISCSYLETITIGRGVTFIGMQAFQNAKAKNVYCYADPTKLSWKYASGDFIYGKKTMMHVYASDLQAWQACFPNANVTFVGDLGDDTRPITEVTQVQVENLKDKGLADTTIDNVYYNINNTNGSNYDEARNCLIIGQTTDMSLIEDATPGSDDIRENFNGIIVQVGPGKGVITIKALTAGWAQLAVRVGNGEPYYATSNASGRVLVSYEVNQETYVYIYSVLRGSLARSQATAADDTANEEEENALYIYGINILPGYDTTTGISELGSTPETESAQVSPAPYYNLNGTPVATPRQKGIYVRNGRKVVVK